MALRDVSRENFPGFGPPWLQGRDVPSGCLQWMWLFPVDISSGSGCFQWIFPWMWLFPVDVFHGCGCFQSMFPVLVSSGFSVLLSLPEDKGAAFPPREAGAGVVPLGISGAVCASHGAGASFCACGRAGNSREWPQNSRHGKDFIAGSKLLEPAAGSQCPEAVEGPESVAEEPGWPGQPSSRAFPNPFGFGMLPDGFETHGRCSIPIFRSIPTVQDIPVQPEGLGLTRMFQLQVFYPPFS